MHIVRIKMVLKEKHHHNKFSKNAVKDPMEKINEEYEYEVNLDSNKLIEKSIKRLNEELKITKMRLRNG